MAADQAMGPDPPLHATRRPRAGRYGPLVVVLLVGVFATMSAIVGGLRLTGYMDVEPSASTAFGRVAMPVVSVVIGVAGTLGAVLFAMRRNVGRSLCATFLGVVIVQSLWEMFTSNIGAIVGLLVAVGALQYLLSPAVGTWLGDR